MNAVEVVCARTSGAVSFEVVIADITTLAVDAIVNAANERLAGGGGVDGAIHRAAGPQLRAACRRIGFCPTGDAVLTPGFRLPARHVIHAVGPIWRGGESGEAELLASAYGNAMQRAAAAALSSIAFASISTGVYRFPAAAAASIAVRTTIAENATAGLKRIIYCCFDRTSAEHHARALGRAALGETGKNGRDRS